MFAPISLLSYNLSKTSVTGNCDSADSSRTVTCRKITIFWRHGQRDTSKQNQNNRKGEKQSAIVCT